MLANDARPESCTRHRCRFGCRYCVTVELRSCGACAYSIRNTCCRSGSAVFRISHITTSCLWYGRCTTAGRSTCVHHDRIPDQSKESDFALCLSMLTKCDNSKGRRFLNNMWRLGVMLKVLATRRDVLGSCHRKRTHPTAGSTDLLVTQGSESRPS